MCAGSSSMPRDFGHCFMIWRWIPTSSADLGADPDCEGERRRLMAALHAWGLRLSQRTTMSERQIRDRRGKSQRRGILIGVWDESEVPAELWSQYLGEGQ